MPQPTKGPRLGGSPAHQRLMLANLATALFEHGRIRTTETKAKRLRPLAEQLITKAKRGDIAARREVLKVVRDKSVVHTLFAEVGPRFAARQGGYTRIVKLEPRKGDNAPMALIELVEPLTVAQQAVGEAEQARGTTFAGGPGSGAGGDTGAVAASAAGAADAAVDVPTEGDTDQPGGGVPGGDRVAVPTEGGDTEVVTGPEPEAEPAENAAGDIVQDLTGGSLTEGETDERA